MLSRVKFKFLCIFIPFFLISLMSHNAFAVEYHSWLNIQDISKTNLSNDWIIHNTANAGSYSVSGSTSLETYRVSASSNLSSQVSGGYFSFSGDIFIDVPNELSGGVICSAINDAKIVPENVTFNVTSSSLTSCVESNPNIYLRRYTLHIVTNGTISSGSPSSFFFSIGNSSNQTIISLVGTPNNSPRVFISGDININLSNSPELQALDEINQNIVIVSQDLQDLSEQMEQNTQSIIDNQNQNTEDIIKSNQHCYIKNYFKVPNTQTKNGVTLTKNSDGSFDLVGFASANTVFDVYVDSSLDAGIYTLSKTGGSNFIVAAVQDWNLGSWLSQLLVLPRSSDYISGSINPIGNRTGFVVQVFNGLSYDFHNIKVQLEKGSSVSSFEPYNKEICINYNQEYYDEQRQADQNISNQSTSDIQGSENQATTNLIGILSNFLTQLQSFQATDCNLSLPFPQFIGGTQVVNICQGKDVLGNFITIIGTLAMVTFYIPLALVLLKMIYNEIRSFTNG